MQSSSQVPPNDSDNIFAELKRIRVCTPEEQAEFGRIGRLLLDNGFSEENLQVALGYENVDAVRKALDTGRITTTRLDRLREVAREKLPAALLKAATNGHPTGAAPTNGGHPAAETSVSTPAATVETSGSPESRESAPISFAPPPVAHVTVARPAAAIDPRAGIKDYLSKAQHQRLRDDVERLWSSDPRFRNWTLLARAGGLSSGQAMKRAYEVGSSRATLASLETFSRLHAGFGSKATIALMEGVQVSELREYLRSRAAEDATEAQNAADAIEMSAEAEGALAETEMTPEAPKDQSEEQADGSAAPQASGRRTRGSGRARKKQHLTGAQHQKLRKEVEGLWEHDARLRNWSLLARAGGLRSGFAMKRAYDVNSSVTTARSLARFGRLLQRFGRAAVDALHGGIHIDALEAHLSAALPERALATAAARTPRAPATTGSDVVTPPAGSAAPNPVDFSSMIELGRAIDAEVIRLAQSAEFFDGVANKSTLPRIVRRSAERARDRLRSAIGLFAGEGTEPEGGESATAP
jgi:hypothetical protein